mmetsp:Transcript_31463/g.74764  ORF Transcript_31463/g.74764 Transcript_31463/m.74764 type:complete len:239 (+) Transcript_31463:4362-5078(+)
MRRREGRGLVTLPRRHGHRGKVSKGGLSAVSRGALAEGGSSLRGVSDSPSTLSGVWRAGTQSERRAAPTAVWEDVRVPVAREPHRLHAARESDRGVDGGDHHDPACARRQLLQGRRHVTARDADAGDLQPVRCVVSAVIDIGPCGCREVLEEVGPKAVVVVDDRDPAPAEPPEEDLGCDPGACRIGGHRPGKEGELLRVAELRAPARGRHHRRFGREEDMGEGDARGGSRGSRDGHDA